jgi:Pyruvate/2-oxoacid:ferredoxin oxidoreductase delta subunit
MTDAFRQIQKEEPQVEQISEHRIVTELAVEAPVRRKITRRNKIYKQQRRTVEGVRQKRCRKCNKWKPESEFHKNSSSKDNLAVSCKICKNNAARERRQRREAAQR